ncbi:hypothetical protein TWF696_001842 [Orbilia brochopaga]|uniref:Uncharacterized protein n=1 Tax=Orbilia brochopaga TaxID=3140254 RepID=A0AAV9UAC6_9PEZI
MLLDLVALITAFAATTFGAALPAGDPTNSLDKRDTVESADIWKIDDDSTEEYSRETDDAWSKVELKFPMQIFDKSSTTIWLSMNGLISLDEPSSNPSVPARDFPIDPASCGLGTSCVSNNTVAVMWQDLYMPPIGANGDLSVEWVHHYPSLSPEIGYHYHFIWSVCDKKTAAGGIPTGMKKCGKASRLFVLNYYENQPGVFHMSWNFDPDVTTSGVIGVQAYPKYMQIPLPENMPSEKYPYSCAILDTVKNIAVVPRTRAAC